jgi:meromycolic acid enoyl-[acyl-carrier-protein] reductase
MASGARGGAGVILAGKRILVTGVLTRNSIAYAVADEAQRAGAEVLLTSFGRLRRMTLRATRDLSVAPDVLELDVSRPEDFDNLAAELERRWGHVDGVLHSIAFAPPDSLGGNFVTAGIESASTAFQISAYSYKALACALLPLMREAPRGASIVGLDFDAAVAWPMYDWMGVAKGALESVNRYLARDLGPIGIRANLVAAGPVATAAASGIEGFDRVAEMWQVQAPLGWNVADATPVARSVCFLMSDWARAITGEILHVDGGFHAVGCPQPDAMRTYVERHLVDDGSGSEPGGPRAHAGSGP